MAKPGSDWLVPHLNGVVYSDKPPVFFWAAAAAQRLGVPLPLAAFLPSVLGAVIAMLATAGIARRLLGPPADLAAAAVLATSSLFSSMAGRANLDAFLTGWITLAMFLWVRGAEESERGGRGARLFGALACLSAGLGVLVKGPVALAIPGVAIALGRVAGATRKLRVALDRGGARPGAASGGSLDPPGRAPGGAPLPADRRPPSRRRAPPRPRAPQGSVVRVRAHGAARAPPLEPAPASRVRRAAVAASPAPRPPRCAPDRVAGRGLRDALRLSGQAAALSAAAASGRGIAARPPLRRALPGGNEGRRRGRRPAPQPPGRARLPRPRRGRRRRRSARDRRGGRGPPRARPRAFAACGVPLARRVGRALEAVLSARVPYAAAMAALGAAALAGGLLAWRGTVSRRAVGLAVLAAAWALFQARVLSPALEPGLGTRAFVERAAQIAGDAPLADYGGLNFTANWVLQRDVVPVLGNARAARRFMAKNAADGAPTSWCSASCSRSGACPRARRSSSSGPAPRERSAAPRAGARAGALTDGVRGVPSASVPAG